MISGLRGVSHGFEACVLLASRTPPTLDQWGLGAPAPRLDVALCRKLMLPAPTLLASDNRIMSSFDMGHSFGFVVCALRKGLRQ